MFFKLISYLFFFMSIMLFFIQGKWMIFVPVFFEFFDFTLVIDWVSLMFLSILFLITGSVLVFSKSYMSNKIFQLRFVWLIMCFVASMMIMMLTPMTMFMLLGWDGLGMFSFLLVCFYKASSSWAASMKTYLTNRMGDAFFMLFFALLVSTDFWFNKNITLFKSLIILFLACFTKSAQIPFSSWLPAAMAAPTPVSSLVHSSTLVTAGVYLLIRVNSEALLFWLGFVGVLTALISAFSALKEYDSKKMVALSTLSKLGMMVYSFSSGLPLKALFHLFTHAVAKANLFMSVGWLMVYNSHHQDVRLLNKSTSTKLLLNLKISVCMWSLSGIVFFSGFYSKEKILEGFNSFYNMLNFLSLYLMIFFSFMYSFRLLSLLSFKTSNHKIMLTSKSSFSMSVIFLFFCSMFLGSSMNKFLLNFSVSVSMNKSIIYTIIFISMLVLSFDLFFKKKMAKELVYMKFLGSSLGMLMGSFSNKMFKAYKIKLYSLTNSSSVSWVKMWIKSLKFMSLKYFFWISSFMVFLLI